MANPWDTENIKPNLKTLAGLESGDKFRILATGLIDRNRYFQGLQRSDSDSIRAVARSGNQQGVGDEQLDAVTRLFKRAVELSRQGGQWSLQPGSGAGEPPVFVSRSEVEKALAGLEAIRGSYADKPSHLQSLDGLIHSVKAQLPPPRAFPSGHGSVAREDYEGAKARFAAAYKDQQVVELTQGDYTLYGQGGICNAMVLDWVRRRLVKKRSSYADTKKWFPDPLQQRVQARAEKRLHRIQNILNDPGNEGVVADVAPTYPKFADLRESRAISDRDWPIKAATPAEAVADKMIVKLFKPVLKNVLGWITDTEAGHETYCFKLVLGGKGGMGHSIAFDFRSRSADGPPEVIHLFDPNNGEYEFGIDGQPKRALFAFFDDLWRLYAMQGQIYRKWRVRAFSHQPQTLRRSGSFSD
jgi:hypothetical protein